MNSRQKAVLARVFDALIAQASHICSFQLPSAMAGLGLAGAGANHVGMALGSRYE
jgi:hypothetical protein